jgi:hypothetical protein
MPMTQPLPAEGSFNWYPWASEVHNDLNGISAFGATLIDAADAATARTTIGALSSAAGAVEATNLAASLPRGAVTRSIVTASQTGLTNVLVDLTGLTVTWTATSNRLYRISFSFPLNLVSGTPAASDTYITDASNSSFYREGVLTTNATVTFAIKGSTIQTGLSGSVTRKLRFQMLAAANYTMSASATNPAYILVEDIGAA